MPLRGYAHVPRILARRLAAHLAAKGLARDRQHA
jgi:hypothetical protein